MPDLPKANYQVFVRGYGLVDSPRVTGRPGKLLNLTASDRAQSESAAAEYYPANYWFAMLKLPAKSEFPIRSRGRRPARARAITSKQLKTDGCISCHQIGNKPTREIPPEPREVRFISRGLGKRVTFGHDGGQMDGQLTSLGRQRTLKMFADWTDRIAEGRVSGGGAAAAAGSGAQRRDHAVGLGGSARVLPRRRSRATSAIPWSIRTVRCTACTRTHPIT